MLATCHSLLVYFLQYGRQDPARSSRQCARSSLPGSRACQQWMPACTEEPPGNSNSMPSPLRTPAEAARSRVRVAGGA
ncbi:hypothetical protein NDU88_005325 [Pleurodeles waltl]|uniref:Uncharacterized protein n=1 Tax=Pleurodeles waltl TaxID=8319 RepID=A0AAV7MXQ1_PLEWA|nr:hypothetical protein NDU88_005325 [Pleurodeles waltl]